MDNTSDQISQQLISNNFVQPESSNSSSFFSWFNNISWTTWVLIFIVLAFLGFNILLFLAKGVGEAGGILNQIIQKIKDSGKIVNTIKQLINTSAMGTKGIIDSTTNIADNTLNKIEQATEITSSTPIIQSIPAPTQLSTNQPNQLPNQNMPPLDVAQANTLNRALNSTQPENRNVSQDYEADDSYSKIQTGGSSKSGWCLIGEDRGFRSCAQVGESDICMSGQIFPTNDICINPRLRA
jgi:hypothetical protein